MVCYVMCRDVNALVSREVEGGLNIGGGLTIPVSVSLKNPGHLVLNGYHVSISIQLQPLSWRPRRQLFDHLVEFCSVVLRCSQLCLLQ